MSPRLEAMTGVQGVAGFRATGVHAGLKSAGRPDVGLIVSDHPGTTAAAVFTQNSFAAAPVHVSRQHVADGSIRAIVVNSGNANACTGRQGLRDALDMARETARCLGLRPEQVLVCSTGRIGIPLPIGKVLSGIQECARRLDHAIGGEISQAILTTDSGPKEADATFTVAGVEHTVAGIAKGAGMIHPNMATMLSFLVTDASVPAPHLRRALKHASDRSFNQISVDGDESTNDTCVILANGAAGGDELTPDHPEWDAFQNALTDVCQALAKMIAADGEGATRLLHVHVTGAASDQQARAAARAIARSNLVKAALHGKDPNWGRIVSALGATDAQVDPAILDLSMGNLSANVRLLTNGEPEVENLEAARALLDAPEVVVHVELHQGRGRGTAWGCDLTTDYVTFNSAYTT